MLASRAPSTPRPIASLAKIMTALLVLERLSPSQSVTVDARATEEPGARIGLAVGERISVRNLLYALLLYSADDAAVALAERAGGSLPAFVAAMNDRARALGLAQSHFTSPDGYDAGTASTPNDLAALTRVAYARPLFASIVGAVTHTIPSATGRPVTITNRNVLVAIYPGAIGVKTGFTTPAGHCLVVAARRGDLRLVAVLLDEPSDPDKFGDGRALLDYGFGAFRRVTVVRADEPLGTVLASGTRFDAVAAAPLAFEVRVDLIATLTRRLVAEQDLRPPVRDGEVVGREVVSAGGREVGSVPVVARATAPARASTPVTPADAAVREAAASLDALVRALFDGFL